MKIPAQVCRLDERALRDTPKEVLVAMAAPSCVKTGEPRVDAYAAIEASIARENALLRELDTDEIFDLAKAEVERTEEDILRIAHQLAESGWVDFESATAREP
jgi:hypothetical protein